MALALALDTCVEICYNSYMNTPQYQVLRIWKTTHRILRQIASQTDESLVELLDRMAREEQQRIQRKAATHEGIQVPPLSEQRD